MIEGGKTPFADTTKERVIEKIKTGIFHIQKRLSEECKQFLKKCLQYRPEKRYTLQEVFECQYIKMDLYEVPDQLNKILSFPPGKALIFNDMLQIKNQQYYEKIAITSKAEEAQQINSRRIKPETIAYSVGETNTFSGIEYLQISDKQLYSIIREEIKLKQAD